MPDVMNKLNAKTKALIFIGVKQYGSFDPEIALCGVEEQMTGKEATTAFEFLSWVYKNKKVFGTATIDERFEEFKEAK